MPPKKTTAARVTISLTPDDLAALDQLVTPDRPRALVVQRAMRLGLGSVDALFSVEASGAKVPRAVPVAPNGKRPGESTSDYLRRTRA